METVPSNYIQKLAIQTDPLRGTISLTSKVAKTDNGSIQARLVSRRLGDKKESIQSNPIKVDLSNRVQATIPVQDAQLWTPDSPWLYDVEVSLLDASGKVIDQVTTYAGLRSISIGKAEDGYVRMLLNGKPLFQYGPLDQGWWPDGLYTPPTQKAMEYDVDLTKMLGFNMARKHIKVEPDRWYAYCDSVGLLVWQDFPSGMVAQAGSSFNRIGRKMGSGRKKNRHSS